MMHCRYVYISIHVQSDGFVPDFFSIVQLSDRLHMIFVQGNVNEITIPMLPSTVTESPSRMPATISVQELLKSVAQQLRYGM
jgi:hypothetical protein